jgi:hypothetical protein
MIFCFYGFRTFLIISSDYPLKQHYPVDFCNGKVCRSLRRTEFLNVIYMSFGFKTTFFHLPDCWVVVIMHSEGPVTRHLDNGFLGFPLSLSKWFPSSKLLLPTSHAALPM